MATEPPPWRATPRPLAGVLGGLTAACAAGGHGHGHGNPHGRKIGERFDGMEKLEWRTSRRPDGRRLARWPACSAASTAACAAGGCGHGNGYEKTIGCIRS